MATAKKRQKSKATKLFFWPKLTHGLMPSGYAATSPSTKACANPSSCCGEAPAGAGKLKEKVAGVTFLAIWLGVTKLTCD